MPYPAGGFLPPDAVHDPGCPALPGGPFRNQDAPVDYLDHEAVERLLARTYAVYYRHFAEFFGETIVCAFYDEPSIWHVDGGRDVDALLCRKVCTGPWLFSGAALFVALEGARGSDDRGCPCAGAALWLPFQAVCRGICGYASPLVQGASHPPDRAYGSGGNRQPHRYFRRPHAGDGAAGYSRRG